MGEKSFISIDQNEELEREGRFFKRFIQEKFADNISTHDQSEPFEKAIASRLRTLRQRRTSWFESFCISVQEGDGMSWSAEKLRREILKSFPGFNLLCLSDRISVGQLPQISTIIGDRKFLRLAVKRDLTDSFKILKPWVTPLILILAICLGIGISAFTTLNEDVELAQSGSVYELLNRSSFYIKSSIITLLSLLSQHIISILLTQTTPSRAESFISDLDSKLKTNAFSLFADDLAKALLRLPLPRVVILDDYGRIDYVTKYALSRYVERYAENVTGSELWAVFERKNDERFGDFILLKKGTYYKVKIRFFDQLLLTKKERSRLAKKCGNPGRSEFLTVKNICMGVSEELVRTFFLEHRRANPKQLARYGHLDLLYLLALTSRPENFELSRHFLESNLTAKSGLRKDVLELILLGSRMTKDEMRASLDGIESEFPNYIDVSHGESGKSIRIRAEARDTLIHIEKELDLPSSIICHIFWSILWFDKVRHLPFQSYWARKLADHLLEGVPSVIEVDNLYLDVQDRLITAILFTVNACIRTCVFYPLPLLLEKATSLANDIEDASSLRANLQALSWQTYLILGNETALKSVLNLLREQTKEGKGREVIGRGALLRNLFFDSIELAEEQRAAISLPSLPSLSQDSIESRAVANFAEARAAWLALALKDFSKAWPTSTLYNTAKFATEQLPKLLTSITDTIQTYPENEVAPLDLASLSIVIWCHALLVGSKNLWQRGNGGNALPFAAFLDTIETIILVVTDFEEKMERRANQPSAMEFVMKAFIREIVVVSFCALLISSRSEELATDENARQEREKQIDGIFKCCDKYLEDFHVETSDRNRRPSSERKEVVERAMGISVLIWRRLELEQIALLLNVRLFQFRFLCRDSSGDDYGEYKDLLKSISAGLEAGGFSGLLTNSIASVCLTDAGELRGHFIHRAASLAVHRLFGRNLRRELSLFAIDECHSYRWPLENLLGELTRHETGENDYLSAVLENVSQPQLPIFALRLLNVATLCENEDELPRMIKRFSNVAESAEHAEIAAEMLSLTAFFRCKREMEKGTALDLETILDEFSDFREHWPYAAILNLCLERDLSDQRVIDQSVELIAKRPMQLDNTVYIYLACSLVEEFAGRDELEANRPVLLPFLTEAASRWNSRMTAESNLRVYGDLARLDREKFDIYAVQMSKWQAIAIQRDELSRIPQLIEAGRFFLIFHHYFSSMEIWGLETEISRSGLYNQLHVGRDIKLEQLEEFKRESVVVSAFLERDGENVVSSTFLTIGYFAFSLPDSEVDAWLLNLRKRLDVISQQALPELFEMIAGLPRLPEQIRELLGYYARRFEVYAPIEE